MLSFEQICSQRSFALHNSNKLSFALYDRFALHMRTAPYSELLSDHYSCVISMEIHRETDVSPVLGPFELLLQKSGYPAKAVVDRREGEVTFFKVSWSWPNQRDLGPPPPYAEPSATKEKQVKRKAKGASTKKQQKPKTTGAKKRKPVADPKQVTNRKKVTNPKKKATVIRNDVVVID
jgi:hypothetical protein